MGLHAIVEDYLQAATKQAIYEELPGCGIGATVPGFTGVVAIGNDYEGCAVELRDLLEDAIQLTLAQGDTVPVLGGINLNRERSEVLASFQDSKPLQPEHEFFPDTEAFEKYLASVPYVP